MNSSIPQSFFPQFIVCSAESRDFHTEDHVKIDLMRMDEGSGIQENRLFGEYNVGIIFP